MKKLISILLVLVLVFSVVACSTPQEKEEKQSEDKKEDKKEGYGIPLKTLDGKTVLLSDFVGKKVYIEFMATW